MRFALPFAVVAALSLTACAHSAPAASAPAPVASPAASASPSAPVASTSAPAGAAPTASAVPLISAPGGPLAEAPACGDGVVVAAAMSDAGTPEAAHWIEAGAPAVGFEPAGLLDGVAVRCAITFLTQPDGAPAMVEVSQAYAVADDLAARMEAWAATEGYAASDREEPFPLAFERTAEPAAHVEAFPLDWDALGANGLAWHEEITGFDLDATDWVIVSRDASH